MALLKMNCYEAMSTEKFSIFISYVNDTPWNKQAH